MNFDINDLTAPPAPICWVTYTPDIPHLVTVKTWFEARQALSSDTGIEPGQLEVFPDAD